MSTRTTITVHPEAPVWKIRCQTKVLSETGSSYRQTLVHQDQTSDSIVFYIRYRACKESLGDNAST